MMCFYCEHAVIYDTCFVMCEWLSLYTVSHPKGTGQPESGAGPLQRPPSTKTADDG